MNTLPLLPDFPDDAVLAYRNAQPISRGDFLRDVMGLAQRLPANGHVLNMCVDRYWFSVAFFAAIARGLVSLLPNSAAEAHIATVSAGVSKLLCLSDHEHAPVAHVPHLRVGQFATDRAAGKPDVPRIPFDQCVATVFTSGSTGQPQPHNKTFGRLQQCANAAARRLWTAESGPCSVLGTVPLRHMYGLELTVLLPILCGGRLSDRIPFYPADVASALAELPPPRLLVTTPFHLRKLLDAKLALPPIAAVLSATAPLSQELASRAEAQCAAPLMEIYGSTETGQLAMRRPTMQTEWQAYDGIALSQDGDVTVAVGGHLEGVQALNDNVELISPSVFRLVDRKSDMVNIVGKRTSMAFLNHVITSLPGVREGFFCLPAEHAGQDLARLAAFVVAPGLHPADILAGLRPHLDPIFLPRPIVVLESLPRDGNGKVSQRMLQSLVEAHITTRAPHAPDVDHLRS